ncbi:MAG: hypothetical protein ABSH00_00630 [Bryobacteraceae bacterium]|jgi:hypothetical protein
MKMANPYSRRDFVALSVAGPLVGWLPWFRPKELVVGDARFRIVRNHRSTRRYVLLDGGQDAARQVLLQHMESQRGTAYLIEGAAREVEIAGGKLDPNRMFSRAGAEASLRSLNPGWNEGQITAALDLLDRQREKLLDALIPPDRGLLIALGAGAPSVTDAAAIAEQRSLPQPDKPHAFFLCTDPGDYQALAASPYNVVLSRNVVARDDGSLDRRAAARQVRFLHIAARPGDAAAQRDMLAWAETHLR